MAPSRPRKSLPAKPSLESLKKQAKALLRAWRRGEAEARARVDAAHPSPATFSALRDAQLVLAREYGLQGWTELLEAVERARVAALSRAAQADLFCSLACLTYESDAPRRRERAARMLALDPSLAGASAHTLAVVADAEELARLVVRDPECVSRADGPSGGTPLATLCYARLPEAPGDPLAAARVLLEAGADPNARLAAFADYHFTPLTGVMGEGEGGVENQPPHPRARELAELLLDHGASPNESQGLYDTHFTPGDDWLELLLARGLTASDRANWMRDDAIGTLDYLLGVAVIRGFGGRVRLLLEHGADPDGRDVYDDRAHYENALIHGHGSIAELLVEHGATRLDLSPASAFQAACFAGDRAAARAWLDGDAALVDDDRLVHDAIRFGSDVTVEIVFDLGASIDARDQHYGLPALHQAALCGRAVLVEKLLALGAPLSQRDPTFDGTPIGAAHHGGHHALRDALLDRTDDVFDLACFERVEQLRDVLAERPAAARATRAGGATPLHELHVTDVRRAGAVIDLLLEAGADLEARTEGGRTPLEVAVAEVDEEWAELLIARGARHVDD